ncbi:MAG: energy transducer TonB [Balneolaceae bacterium]|nr:MAG: energy transducer TonB [Balneolaceae bacterium]
MNDNRLKPNYEIKRKPEANLRNYYTILLQTGLILALLILTALARMDLTSSETEVIMVMEQEEVEMEEIIQTQQQETVPPPPRPPVPVAVPNTEIIEDVYINIDAELDFGGMLDLPPPPPQQEEDEEPEDGFFILVEQMPELIGGLESLQRQVRYPERALRANIQGRVFVQFIVNERGEVENPVVVRGIGGGCDEEAIRVVSQARFVPGMQRGRPVRVQYNLPVVFMIRS